MEFTISHDHLSIIYCFSYLFFCYDSIQSYVKKNYEEQDHIFSFAMSGKEIDRNYRNPIVFAFLF